MLLAVLVAAAGAAVAVVSLRRFSGRGKALVLCLLAVFFIVSTALATRTDDQSRPRVQYSHAAVAATGSLPQEVERWRPLVSRIMPAQQVDRWLELIACESRGNPDATGLVGEVGLVQIHPFYHADATYDPAGNLRAAYRISAGGQDLGPWSCSEQLTQPVVSPERPTADRPRSGGLSAASAESR